MESKFFHLNLHHAAAAARQLAQDLVSQGIDVASLNEPYLREGVLLGVPGGYSIVRSTGTGSRAVLLVHPRVTFCGVKALNDVVAIRCTLGGRTVLVISCYCPPNDDIQIVLDELRTLLRDYPQDSVVLVGDFNAKSTIWGQRPTDPRGRSLISLALEANLEIINDPESNPTYNSTLGSSWIDVLLVRFCATRIADWVVSDNVTESDHNSMLWTYLGRPEPRLPRGHTARWTPRTLVWEGFLRALRTAGSFENYDHSSPDSGVEHLISTLTGLCRNNRKRASTANKDAPWWTTGLSIQRSRLRALRRLYQKCLEPTQRVRLGVLFKQKRAVYRKAVKRAKRISFRRFLSEGLSLDRFGQICEMVRGKWRREAPVPLDGAHSPIGVEASTWEEIQDALARHHFRQVDEVTPDGTSGTSDPDLFTFGELEFATQSLPSRKAPGHDGFSLEVVRAVLKYHGEWLLSLFNHCLRTSCFPRSWKRAIAVFFPKGERDRSNPASYRPICLLPSFGKVLDRMLATRLATHLESRGVLDRRQYGFRRNLSTVDALHEVTEFVSISKREGLHSCILSLDIKNAFNSARRADILRQLVFYEVPADVLSLIDSFLWNRSILLTEGELKFNVGVPQGSCLGPILWLVLINGLLTRIPNDEGVAIQAFADDVLVLARSSATVRFADVLQRALSEIKCWTEENNLELSYEKCVYTVVPSRGKLRGAPSRPILIGDNRVRFVRRLKYLGVVFDSSWCWMPHLDSVQDRVTNSMYRMSRLAAATWGLRPRVRKAVYSATAEKALLYGAPIWYHDHVKLNTRLLSMQRFYLLQVTKCYRTTSTDALSVLAGVLPLDIRARSEKLFQEVTKWNKRIEGTELTPETVETWKCELRHGDLWRIPWSLDLTPKTPYLYFTDGSKLQNSHVGSAYVATQGTEVIGEEQLRLNDGASVFAAEVQAIKAAIEDGLQRGLGEFDVYSDSRSALQALNRLSPQHESVAEIRTTIKRSDLKVHMHWIRAHVGHAGNELADSLAKAAANRPSVDVVVKVSRRQAKRVLLRHSVAEWQSRWDRSELGRATYEVFPSVRLSRLQGDFYVNQALTGHGAFGPHQYRLFNNDPLCFCGRDESSVRHCLYECDLWSEVRRKFFPRDFQTKTLRDLCLDYYSRKGVVAIVSDLLARTLEPR